MTRPRGKDRLLVVLIQSSKRHECRTGPVRHVLVQTKPDLFGRYRGMPPRESTNDMQRLIAIFPGSELRARFTLSLAE